MGSKRYREDAGHSITDFESPWILQNIFKTLTYGFSPSHCMFFPDERKPGAKKKKKKKGLWRNASRWQTGLVFIDPRPIPEGSDSVDPELGPSNCISFRSSTSYASVQFRLRSTALGSLQFQTQTLSTMLRWLKNTEGTKKQSREELRL